MINKKKIFVLLIEDNENHVSYVKHILNPGKYEFRVIRNGTKAVEYLECPQKLPDVILIDNCLEDFEGVDIINYFHKSGYNYPFILLTANGSTKLAIKALKTGAFDYISKQNNLNKELEVVINRTIRCHQVKEQKRKLEKQIRESKEQLEKLNSDKDKFMQLLAHDLKNPMTMLINLTSELKNNFQEYSNEILGRLVDMVDNLSVVTFYMLSDLLLWINSHSGKIAFRPEKINFFRLCEEILSEMKFMAEKKDISIQLQNNEVAIIHADKNMIKTVLRNLISNSIKFTDKNGSIKIKASHKKENVIITVLDTGVGISLENQKKLWDITKYYSTPGTNNEMGTGFGLLLCKEFIDKHGGDIKVESKEGKGSKFTIKLAV